MGLRIKAPRSVETLTDDQPKAVIFGEQTEKKTDKTDKKPEKTEKKPEKSEKKDKTILNRSSSRAKLKQSFDQIRILDHSLGMQKF